MSKKLIKTIKCGLYRKKKVKYGNRPCSCAKDGNTCEAYLATFKYGHKKIDCNTIKSQLNNIDVMLHKAGKLRIKVKESVFTGLNKYERFSICYKKDK